MAKKCKQTSAALYCQMLCRCPCRRKQISLFAKVMSYFFQKKAEIANTIKNVW